MMTRSPPDTDIGAESPGRSGRSIGFWAVALMAGGIAAAALVKALDLGWAGALGVALLLLGMSVVLMRMADRKAVELGCASPALQRYNRRMVLFSIVYMLALFAATYAYAQLHISGAGLWIAGFAPSVGVLGMIWAMARLLAEERDEYLRSRLVSEALTATGLVLVATTVWGFLEQFALVPHVPLWVVMPLFGVMLGLSSCLRWARR